MMLGVYFGPILVTQVVLGAVLAIGGFCLLRTFRWSAPALEATAWVSQIVVVLVIGWFASMRVTLDAIASVCDLPPNELRERVTLLRVMLTFAATGVVGAYGT